MGFFCAAHKIDGKMRCEKCGLSWRDNDPNPPRCTEIYRGFKSQSKLESWLEITINTGSGFVVSYIVYRFVVFPYMLRMSAAEQAWWITSLFTVISLARSYIWRRFFNAGIHKVVHATCARFLAWCVTINAPSKTRQTSVKRSHE